MNHPMQTHGAFSWMQLATGDVDAAKKFYGDTLGWEISAMDMPGGPYTAIRVGDQPIGGMVSAESGGARWVAYVTVDDVDDRLAKAKAGGAKVVAEPFDAPGVGRIATIEDPFGAHIALITYSQAA
ncbi:MAG: VOC family protein [Pseudomonadota bacterium]